MTNYTSIWKPSVERQAAFPELAHDLQVDILIIGAGITGITTALQLLDTGKSIAVIEAGKIAEGTTGYSTANLYIPVQPTYRLLKARFGQELVNSIIQARKYAIDFIEEMVSKYQINCHLMRRPLYLFTTDQKKNKSILKEIEALQAAGITAQIANVFPLPIRHSMAAVIENQARCNPFLYVHALAKRLSMAGCQIYENTAVRKIKEGKESVTIYTEHNKIIADKVVMATHIPKGIHKTQFLAYPYRSYAIAVQLKDNRYPNGNFWHIDSPFYAISTHNVLSEKIDYMLIAGYSHKSGHPREKNHLAHFSGVKSYALKNFDVASVQYQWSAQHYQTADGIPYIGLAKPKSEHLYIATGYHADGLVYGTVAGLLLSDLILKKENPWAKVYDPHRFTPMASSLRFMKENIWVFYDYIKGFASHIRSKESELEQIQKDEGKVLKLKGKKWAVYRDTNNKLHIVSAICSHMACVVKWNDAEKSWDCPCHGSRFAIDGKVIEGPALTPLAKR